MTQRILNYGRHLIEEDDIEAVASVLRGDLITQGPVVERFETALAKRVGARHAVAVTSGTAGLHLAALAAGLEAGHHGVTSAMTFVASANVMHYCSAGVGLCDIDPDTLNMAPSALARFLDFQPETSVVIPVHFAGLAADSKAVRKVAGKRIVIEDACHSFGATYECGRPVGCGAYADMSVFSFHPVKPVTTGEGGAVVTNDPDLAHRLRMLRTHGIERDAEGFEFPDQAFDESGEQRRWYYEQQQLGFNYRLTDIQAALGLSQLGKLEGFLARRREIARAYDETFTALPFLTICQSAPEYRARSGHHLYIVKFDLEALGATRLEIVKRLMARNVGTQVHYIPVYRQPYHSRILEQGPEDFPVTEEYYQGCLSLPIFPGMTDDEVSLVIAAVEDLPKA